MRFGRLFFIHAGFTGLFLLGCANPQVRSETTTTANQSGGQEVKFSRIGTGDYQSFVGNWDDQKDPALYAVLQSPEQFAEIFHPAPTNPPRKPFAPTGELFQKEQILLVSRVMPAPENMDKAFEVQRVTANGQELTLHYQLQPPTKGASYTVKNFLAVRVPKGNYTRIAFVENGKKIGELRPTEGVWSVPKFSVNGKP